MRLLVGVPCEVEGGEEEEGLELDGGIVNEDCGD